MLTNDEIKKKIEKHETKKYDIDKLYFQGQNVAIIDAPNKRKPDNRVPTAFVNRIIKNLSGYAARPADVYAEQVAKGGKEIEGGLADAKDLVYKENNEYILNSKLYKQTLKHGYSYDVVWIERNGEQVKIKNADIPIDQCIPIWKDDLASVKELDEFIRVYMIDEEKRVMHFYTGGYTVYSVDEKRDNKLTEIEQVIQPFDRVQVSAYKANDEGTSYWQPVKATIDEFDKVISKSANEVDRFNDAWMAFVGKIDPETKAKINEMGVIDNLQNALREGVSDIFPRFIERNIPTEHTRFMTETLEQLIWVVMGQPNPKDNSANVSLETVKMRFLGLEYAACEVDTYFDMGLKNRDMLIEQAIKSLGGYGGFSALGEYEVKIVHRRNLPSNLADMINNAVMLKTLVSDRAVLEYLPEEIVSDVDAELEALQGQRPTITIDDEIENELPTV